MTTGAVVLGNMGVGRTAAGAAPICVDGSGGSVPALVVGPAAVLPATLLDFVFGASPVLPLSRKADPLFGVVRPVAVLPRARLIPA
jgi:hypothetical protein